MLVGVVRKRWRTRIGAIVILPLSLASRAFEAVGGMFVVTHLAAPWT